MTRPPTLLEQLAVGMAAAAVTRAVLERLDRRRRPQLEGKALAVDLLQRSHKDVVAPLLRPAAGCVDCIEVDLARSTPGQPPFICGQTLMAPPAGGCS